MRPTGESSAPLSDARLPEGALVVSGLRKLYGGRVVVDGLSFHVEPGEIYGLLGPNGAGKTTTIGMLATVLVPDEGSAAIQGLDAGSPHRLSRHIGLVPQQTSLYPPLTAEANLRLFGRIHGLAAGTLAARVEQMLVLAGLEDRRRDPVRVFSGGMQRRLNLVCGLVHRPRVLLLDEPTTGVDPQSRERIFEMIERQSADGLSIVYTTHYMEEAERLCHRIGILDGGRLVAEGTQGELAMRLGDERVVTVRLSSSPTQSLRRSLESLGAVTSSDGAYVLEGAGLERRVRGLLESVESESNAVRSMNWSAPDLESLFLRLTGKDLRD